MDNLALKAFADNPVVVEAVRSFLLSKFYEMPTIPAGADDTQLGQILRARLEGSRKVEEAFKEIARLQTTNKTSETVNPAR